MGVAASRRLQSVYQYHRKPIWGFTQMFAEGQIKWCCRECFSTRFASVLWCSMVFYGVPKIGNAFLAYILKAYKKSKVTDSAQRVTDSAKG